MALTILLSGAIAHLGTSWRVMVNALRRSMTIARILFPLPLPEPFDYLVPDGMGVEVGAYVQAPLGKLSRTGVVWEIREKDTTDERTLKEIEHVYDVPRMTAAMRKFIDFSSRYTVASPGAVLAMSLRSRGGLRPSPTETVYYITGQKPPRMTPAREKLLAAAERLGPASSSTLAAAAEVSNGVISGLVKTGALETQKINTDKEFPNPNLALEGKTLTNEQASAAQQLREAIRGQSFAPFLLDGVTGSGKTEVYFEAIAEALGASSRTQVLVLLPEIALTQAILSRFEERFGAVPAPWHSGLSEKERRRTWRETAHGRARIVIGARSALFLPYQSLSLIIVDEEHDTSFKQEDGVRYHARDLAVMRAKIENSGVILASATPSLETSVNADLGRYTRVKLSARPGAAKLPEIELVDMRATPPERGHWLSPSLRTALAETLNRGEQSLLFMNRRGYAPLVICKSCGDKLKSPQTESWLTEHRYTGQLICHVTGYTIPKPKKCPKCGAPDSLVGVGPGVERVMEEARLLLPNARIAIFSSDTATSGDETRALISQMARGEIDVLVGTQIVAKGHNFPNLTLVGVIDADAGTAGGDLRAGERTYQLLSQVAGRAGRAEKPGRALLQTWKPEDPAMQALKVGDRESFLQIERTMREMLNMPPFGRLASVVISAPSPEAVNTFAAKIAAAAPNGENIDVFGPASPALSVVRGRHRRRFLVQAPKTVDLSAYMAAWRSAIKVPSGARIVVDIDPYSFR